MYRSTLALAVLAALSVGQVSADPAPAYDETDSLDSAQPNNTFGQKNTFAISDAALSDGAIQGRIGNGKGSSAYGGDVDFFAVTDVIAGDFFTAELQTYSDGDGQPSTGDGLLAYLDDTGAVLAASDGAGGGSLPSGLVRPAIGVYDNPKVGGVVPSGGNLNLAVTGLGDNDLSGTSSSTFDYDLSLAVFTLGGPDQPDDLPVELPDNDPEPGEPFEFGDLVVEDGRIVTLDPLVATGYDFEIISGAPTFATAVLPSVGGDSNFFVTVDNTTMAATAGQLIDLTLIDADVPLPTSFSVSGIDPGVGLDPTDPLAFAVTITFNDNGVVDVNMTPQTLFVPSDAPAPGVLWLLGGGLLGLAAARRKVVAA